MENNKKTMIFIYGNMYIGGVENYLIRLIRKLKANGNRIIWLTNTGTFVDEVLKPDLLDGYVEIVNVKINDLTDINNVNIVFGDEEEAVSLAFDISSFMQMEILKKNHKNNRIDNFYWVSHFEGIFLEEMLPKPIQGIARKFVGKIICAMEKNDNIIYVVKSHADAFMNTYNYKIENLEKKFLAYSRDVSLYNDNLALRRSIRNEFNIITVGRFDFPHKEYLIGLIREYAKLKNKYNKIKLTIIGYGKDESKVLEEINKLPVGAKKDITLVGKVPYDDLRGYFEKAHLNIGVAGTICDGALTGLISIPVRHYSETCEGYGYLPESKSKIVSSEPGIPIGFFIEEVISMSQEEYLQLSRKAYDAYIEGSSISILSILNYQNKNPRKTLPARFLYAFKLYKRIRNIVKYISKYKIK